MGSQYREIHNTHRNIIYVADTTHSKMGSQYQKVHNTHRDMRGRYNPLEDGFSIPKVHNTHRDMRGRYNPLEDGFSIPRSTQYMQKHTWQIQPTRRWVLNTEKYTIRTETYKADPTHSKMGSQYQEVHNTHGNIHGRYNPLEDGFSIPRSTQYMQKHTWQIQPTRRWVLNTEKYTIHTET